MRTPTPWTYDAKWCLIMGPNGEEIAAMHTGQPEGHPRHEPTAGENARLMIAAPALLAALEAAVLRVEMANKDGDPILSAWLPDARAAVAAAQGQTS